MKTPAALALCLSLLAGLIACDKDDNMGTLIVNVRDNAKVEELNIYTEGGSLIYTNTEYLYQNDPRLSREAGCRSRSTRGTTRCN